MTVRGILLAMTRRWYVSVLIMAAAGALFVLFSSDGGGYTTRTLVTFLRPYATSLTPSNGANDYSVIAFAGSVAAEVNNGRDPARYSTDEAPYYGAGIREGVLVTVPSDGNQWYDNFTRAEIEIQIVGRDYAWVETRQQEVIASVLRAAESQQSVFNVPEDMYISADVVPMTLAITPVSASRTAQIASAGALLVAGIVVSAWASVAIDRRFGRRTRRSTAYPSQRIRTQRTKEFVA